MTVAEHIYNLEVANLFLCAAIFIFGLIAIFK